jgi:cytochrome d ubiquinol oxidase subunit I
VVYGEIRTVNAASNLPASDVLVSLIGFATVYSFLFVCALYFGSRIIRHGPSFDIPIPGIEEQPALVTEPGDFNPNERPTEAQQ